MPQNTSFTQPEPSFEESLYAAMKSLHSGLTVRTFSMACLGRSMGYYSSTVAQGLQIPNATLITLTDYLETQKILNVNNAAKVKMIDSINQMIEDEILNRLKVTTQISRDGWNRLAQSIREDDEDEKYGYLDYKCMPFSIHRY